MGGVGVACHGKEAVQGSAKLHGLGWRMWYGVSVDTVKTQIDNQSGTAIPLGPGTTPNGDSRRLGRCCTKR
jgi:hypothetical protein